MMSQRIRIAVGQVSSESNHFVASPCDVNFFKTTGYVYEDEAFNQLDGSDTEIGGILAASHDDAAVELVPLLVMRGNSSGPLSTDCYAFVRNRMLQRLRKAGRVDGVIMSNHGSMAAEDEDDPDGDLAQAIREIVGPRVPLAMTLDLHGNITRRMVQAADLIVPYKHYPHDDVRHTGERAMRLLLARVRGQVRPVMARAALPMLLTGFHGSTLGDAPFAQLVQQACELENEPGVLSASLSFVGSYIDVPEMGCSSLVITDGDTELAEAHARRLAQAFWQRRHEFAVRTVSVTEAVRLGRQIEGGPVLLLDTADTTGGGASGDGIGVVRELIDLRVTEPSLAMVVDPEAAQQCMGVPIGESTTVRVGHKLDPAWGRPINLTATVVTKSDGRFRYSGGILGGTWASMGPSVVLALGNLRLLVMSVPTYDWACEQYESVGLDPREAKFVGVKNMMNFRFGYGDIMRGHFVLDLPGPTPADMRALPFKRARRPIYPLDAEPPQSVKCEIDMVTSTRRHFAATGPSPH